jgi:hypothetical protein
MELMLVIALIGVIAAPLAAAIMVGEATTSATANRLESSHDAQLVSIYLPADIQSTGAAVGDVDTSLANTDCSGKPNLLRLRWTTTEALLTPVTYSAAYAVTQAGTEWRLTRYYCGPNGTTAIVVARNLSGATQPTPTVSPDGKTVSMTLTEAGVARDPAHYTYTISGKRRTT